MFIFIYICFADAVQKSFNWKFSNSFFFNLLSSFWNFLPSYFQHQAFSFKFLPRSGIFFQVTSKIRHFLPSYFQDQAFSSKLLPRFTHFYKSVNKLLIAVCSYLTIFLVWFESFHKRVQHVVYNGRVFTWLLLVWGFRTLRQVCVTGDDRLGQSSHESLSGLG